MLLYIFIACLILVTIASLVGLASAFSIVRHKLRYDRLIRIDPRFRDAKPIPGLEHYGRAIRNADGSISGSAANYEHSRGSTTQDGPEFHELAVAIMMEQLSKLQEIFKSSI